MQKIKSFFVKVMVALCLTFVIIPEASVITNTPVEITAQAATYSKLTIKHVQEKLNAKGYSCGHADGVIGKKTKAAIRDYQKDHGFKITGTINKALLSALNIKAIKISYSSKNDPIVYVTEYGTKYHRAGCRYLWNSKIPMRKSEAKKSYSPCSVCNP